MTFPSDAQEPGQEAPQAGRFTERERGALRWLYGFVATHRGRLAAVLALALATTAVVTVQPYLMKLIIDDGILAGDMIMIVLLTGAMLATGLLNLGLGGLNRYQHVKLSGLVLFGLRESVYAHLQRLSPSFFGRLRTGDVLQRLDGDVAELQRFAVDALLAAINGVLTLIAALALMLWLSPALALIAFVLLPLDVLYLRWMRPRVARRTRQVRERVSDISAFLVERLPAIKFVQAMAAEARESERFHGLNHAYLGDLLRLQVTEFLTAAVPNLLTSVSRALVFLAGGALIIRGDLTLGALIAFSTYLGFAVGPVQGLLGLYVALTRMRVSLDRVMALTEAPVTVSTPSTSRTPPADHAGAIRFEGVRFTYPETDAPVLIDVDLEFPGGAKVGVVGPSGVGKTTLIDLLHRHYDPDTGRITIDGIDLREMDLATLRRHVAVVAQDVVLFRGSIADNIRYAQPAASDEAVRAAAARAQIDGFIEGLAQGYDTPIGERGARLSGGQRQRLAIARAILQKPTALVLDEATSAVDIETERRLIAAVDENFADRTRIIVSHRRETLDRVDRLVEMRDGRLSLLALPGEVP